MLEQLNKWAVKKMLQVKLGVKLTMPKQLANNSDLPRA
jgi:hypothetical protein